MRKIIFIILSVVLVCNTSFAQDVKNESKSKSIEFMAECGNLIKKSFMIYQESKVLLTRYLSSQMSLVEKDWMYAH